MRIIKLKPKVEKGDAELDLVFRFGCIHVETKNGWLSYTLSICYEKKLNLFLWAENFLIKGAGLYFNLAENAGVLLNL